MITPEQWSELRKYVEEQLVKVEKFEMSDAALERLFGITHPFWDEMCEFAREANLPYTGNKHWATSDGEPTVIEYARRK
jgi:hypothetical protein